MMGRLAVGGMAVLLLAQGVFADDEIVCRDTFDSQLSIKNWYCESGFSIRCGEGADGSGALVWEESAIRPKPPPGTEPVVQEEDNIVRKLPQDGRKICSRRIPVEPGCRYTG